MRGDRDRDDHDDDREELAAEESGSRPFYWDYRPPSSRDIEMLDRAPTEAALIRERQARIRILGRGRHVASKALARRLSRLPPPLPINLAACPFNARRFQRFATSRIAKALAQAVSEQKAWCVTVSDRNRSFYGSKYLLDFDIAKSHRRMRKQLERSLPRDAIVFGVLEFHCLSETEFLPHYHLFIGGCERWQIEPLRQYFSSVRTEPKAMVMQPLTNPLRQIAYGLKFNIYRRKPKRGRHIGRAQRLRVNDFRNHMLFLEKNGLASLIFSINGAGALKARKRSAC